MIYFDNAATSFPKAPCISKVLSEYINTSAFNVNRGNYKASYILEEKVYNIRESIKKFFNAKESSTVVFSSGITASINTFIQGFHKRGDHILVSPIEHNAVMRPLEFLKSKGIISYTVIQKKDILNADISKYVKSNTVSLIVNNASNVTGDVLNIEAFGTSAKKHNLAFMVDTAQSAGEIKVDMQKCHIDYLSFTSHKGLLSLQGLGGAIITSDIKDRITPIVFGGTGSQSALYNMPSFYPDKLEAGTLNTPGIIALGETIKYINSIGISAIKKKKDLLKNTFIEEVNGIEGFSTVNLGAKSSVGVVSVVHSSIDTAIIANLLDEKYDIATRVGLHCSPLLHRTLGTFESGGTLRFSFSYFNTFDEVEQCLRVLKQISKKKFY